MGIEGTHEVRPAPGLRRYTLAYWRIDERVIVVNARNAINSLNVSIIVNGHLYRLAATLRSSRSFGARILSAKIC